MPRRSIADLRALCNGNRLSDGSVRLAIAWDDHERARRLEQHGWVTDAEHDAGEGYYADPTDIGAALMDRWNEQLRNDTLDDTLDPDQNGGVHVFCDRALASGGAR